MSDHLSIDKARKVAKAFEGRAWQVGDVAIGSLHEYVVISEPGDCLCVCRLATGEVIFESRIEDELVLLPRLGDLLWAIERLCLGWRWELSGGYSDGEYRCIASGHDNRAMLGKTSIDSAYNCLLKCLEGRGES
jgi:hypothetical protein